MVELRFAIRAEQGAYLLKDFSVELRAVIEGKGARVMVEKIGIAQL